MIVYIQSCQAPICVQVHSSGSRREGFLSKAGDPDTDGTEVIAISNTNIPSHQLEASIPTSIVRIFSMSIHRMLILLYSPGDIYTDHFPQKALAGTDLHTIAIIEIDCGVGFSIRLPSASTISTGTAPGAATDVSGTHLG